MLVGFFKEPANSNCECYIIRYEDRIWLLDNGDTQILRSVIVKTDANSPSPLNEIRMLLPFKNIIDLEDLSDACFLSPAENYFNTPELHSTQDYKIIKEPPKDPQPKSFGVIRHDVGENVKVFCRTNLSSFQIRDCSVIRFQFPLPLQKGKSVELRLKFQITSLPDKVSPGLFPNYFIELSYFSPRYTQEIKHLNPRNEKLEIRVKPILGLVESKFKGGFDIYLYLPPEFRKVTTFNSFKEKYDSFNIAGKETSEKRFKLLWRLRELLRRRNLPEDSLSGIGLDISISGTFTKKYDVEEVVDKMSKRIPPGFWTGIVYKSILLSYTAIALSVIAVFFTLLFFYLNR